MKQIKGRMSRSFCSSRAAASSADAADRTPDDFLADWQLMAKNAATYNEDGSTIAADAAYLHELVRASSRSLGRR